MQKFPEKLQQKLALRLKGNALRSLPKLDGLVDFSSNDYLGFAQNEDLSDKVHEMIKAHFHKNGATGSRLLTGNHPLYSNLEAVLKSHHKTESALVFNSGYDANIGFFSSVPQRGDIIFYDELVHASIRDGIQMSHAKSYKFAHNSVGDLSNHMERATGERLGSGTFNGKPEIYVVTESVFSMDGDSPDLEALAHFCAKKGSHLIVDEAHATGIFGEGTDHVCHLGLEEQVFARIITFGKALGCHGAAILGSESLQEYLVNFARSFIYTTALSPHTLATLLTAYEYLKEYGVEKRQQLQENITYFKQKAQKLGMTDEWIKSNSAIQCMVIPGNDKVKAMASQLQDEGFDVRPILSPTVKEGEERLRFCLHAFNTKKEISRVLSGLKNFME